MAKGLLALGVLVSPGGAFFAAAFLVGDERGSIPYFDAVAQIIPLLIVALVIEVRYLSPRDQLVTMIQGIYGHRWIALSYTILYSVVTFGLVILSETVALSELANQHPENRGLMITAGGMCAGTVALVISVLLPLKEPSKARPSAPPNSDAEASGEAIAK